MLLETFARDGALDKYFTASWKAGVGEYEAICYVRARKVRRDITVYIRSLLM